MTRSPGNTEMRIGEVAARSGMTVRTLRYYEEIGLVAPTGRTDAGYRLYGPDQIERLYRISVLRSLGLSLDAVRSGLDDDASGLRDLMQDHVASLETTLAAQHRQQNRLTQLVDHLDDNGDTSGDLLDLLEDMNMTQPTLERRLSIIVYADIAAAFDHLTNVYGFGPGEITRDEDGRAVHAAIQAGDGELWLHPESEEFGLASPQHLGGASATMAIMVEDVDAHHRHAVEHGANVRYEPVDQPYGYREYSAVDPEGHLWSFMKAIG
ncbi:MerR family transcriptional regulator [Ilumatobacter sp.]|uniref:MerR family transcriptional regulator n=1 Tax=Ilumatobacter sp. TaxID=1967498 RepID=UPI003C3B3E94